MIKREPGGNTWFSFSSEIRDIYRPYYGKKTKMEGFKMNEFWKDYLQLCKDTGRFYKKHWKGVVVLNAAIIGAELAYFAYQNKKFERRYLEKYSEDWTQQ